MDTACVADVGVERESNTIEGTYKHFRFQNKELFILLGSWVWYLFLLRQIVKYVVAKHMLARWSYGGATLLALAWVA